MHSDTRGKKMDRHIFISSSSNMDVSNMGVPKIYPIWMYFKYRCTQSVPGKVHRSPYNIHGIYGVPKAQKRYRY